MIERLTHADFARSCTYLAAESSKWAGDCLTLPEDNSKFMDPATVARFTDGMRNRLDYIDRIAGRLEESGHG